MFGKLKAMLGGGQGGEDADEVAEVVVQTTHGHIPPKTDADRTVPPTGVIPAGSVEDALLAGELRAATKIQMSLVPKTFPPIPGCPPFDLYAILEPAREIGGDFYDFWLNGRENLVLVIGDVSGKGIPAALFMAVCRTYLRAFSRSIPEPARLVEYLNNEVSRHNESCMFVTLFCAVVHLPTGRMTYANAGHNPPFIKKRDGTVSALELADDMPVGFMTGGKFSTRSLKLDTGDSILFYTDGMPEAFNGAGEMLGDEESMRLFGEASSGGCRTVVGQLRAEIDEFADGAEQSDDITLMMYTQLEQSRSAPKLNRGFELDNPLDGDAGMFTLSDLGSALSRPKSLDINDDLGQTLSNF